MEIQRWHEFGISFMKFSYNKRDNDWNNSNNEAKLYLI